MTQFNVYSKPCHRVSWRHPRSHHWHQLDLIITRRSSLILNCVNITRSYHSADCNTDHSLVSSKVRMQPKRIHHSKQKRRPRINTTGTTIPALCEHFAKSIERSLQDCPETPTVERWNFLRDTIYNTAMETFGKRSKQNPNWFEAKILEMEPVVEAKRSALINYKSVPSKKTLATLQKAKRNAQRTARRCANDYWLTLCQNIQLHVNSGNVRGMYEGIRKAFGPTTTKTAPIKSSDGAVIKDRSKQMERWVEHYQELYSQENVVTEAALNSIKKQPEIEELDNPPSLEELCKAIDSLSSGKAPGKDAIPPEVIKAGKNTPFFITFMSFSVFVGKKGWYPRICETLS
ncbi:uncharacterized protein [Amphiura filiformis]|uniref:uncharacterized protein n=1 Tax=Amphiura filiformis TaxID=82378 RepID=UPI003B211A9B